MTPRDFCQSEQSNGLKGAVHGAMLVGAVACCAYNVSACVLRKPEPHLVVNALVYGALVALEVIHVRHHMEGAAHEH